MLHQSAVSESRALAPHVAATLPPRSGHRPAVAARNVPPIGSGFPDPAAESAVQNASRERFPAETADSSAIRGLIHA